MSFDNSKYDKAILSYGDKNIIVDINGFIRWEDYNLEIRLTDGTKMTGHPEDITLLNTKSESMRQIEESLSPIYVSDEGYIAESDKLDRAMIQVGNDFITVPITEYVRWNQFKIQLFLEDGTSMNVNPMDITLYSSGSYIMYQIEQKTLNNNSKKKGL